MKKIYHYGMPRRSGRYPWGSGEDPYQRAIGWRGHVKNLKEQGLSEVDIAEAEGITTTQLRARNSITDSEVRAVRRAEVIRLSERGMSNTEISRRMGIGESSVRSLMNAVTAERAAVTNNVANMLKDEVDNKRFIDIGAGVENYVGVRRTNFNKAVNMLQEEGYKIHNLNVPQAGIPDQFTKMKVLGAPDTEWIEIKRDPIKIDNIKQISNDFGRSFRSDLGVGPVKSISSKRVKIVYAEDGESDKDGVIELRRGTKDLDMGGSKYAQVRIGVDDSYFLKGMAIYNDNMPKGVDVIFNTNKNKSVPMMGPKDNTVLKPMKKDKEGNIDQDNPFGATIKDGGQRGALNIVNEEGDWLTWSKTLSSQVLSKQPAPLAKKQLDLALKQKQEEYNEIINLTNPIIKKQLLLAFGDDADAAAVHLKAAGLPRQASKVLLPVPELKPNEIYAPTFRDGETVVLIRHPHGGTFEIPSLIVNNKSPAAKAIMKDAVDAVGIHPSAARKLSGADFDGDTAIVIPNNTGAIRISASLKGLKDFDPIEAYPSFPGMIPIKPRTKQTEMGKVSNLITDMTIKGANVDEIARAVRHSMVVIDAEKHNLNYRQSYKDNGIAALKALYQNSDKGGASTVISRAKSTIRVDQIVPRKAAEGGPIDPVTGKKIYTLTDATYTDKKGKIIKKTTEVAQMSMVDDAHVLSSGRQIEMVYAGYANELKNLGNQARREALAIIPTPRSASAAKVYAKEVNSLQKKLDLAIMNAPKERQAQIITDSVVKRKRIDNPDMDYDELKKVRNQALTESRVRTGAGKNMIDITSNEWEAIQSGAISPSKLSQILQNAKLEQIKELATPRPTTTITPVRVSRAKAMINAGATLAETADALGVSVSTLAKALQ